jgi:hypothetical protein
LISQLFAADSAVFSTELAGYFASTVDATKALLNFFAVFADFLTFFVDSFCVMASGTESTGIGDATTGGSGA